MASHGRSRESRPPPAHHRHYQSQSQPQSVADVASIPRLAAVAPQSSPAALLQPSAATYESILNSTLLFFVEKLIERSPRTLHDLSCQFGSAGFTREMRAIAGNSQAGLKRFLLSYPSLFAVNADDTVVYSPTVVRVNGDATDNSADNIGPLDKDTLQAIEYFQKRLLQYGSNVHVPIKSLQGHRSQAPLVIRHIVGQQLDQFVKFLQKHESVFTVEGDFVWLTAQHGGENSVEFKELDCDQLIDSEKVNRVIRFVQSTIENNGPMLVEQLFHRIGVHFESEQVFKTPSDLATFLRMQNMFQVHSNLVTLTFVEPQQFQTRTETPDKQSNTLKANFRVGESKPVAEVVPTRNSRAYKNFQPVVPSEKAENGPGSFTEPLLRTQPARKVQRNHVNNVILQAINSNVTDLPADNITLITNTRKGKQITDSELITADAIGIDCEGVNLGPEGQITLIQIGTKANEIYIFDMLVKGMNDLLKPVLESKSIVKVMHDCRNDSVNLHNQYEITLANVFDTQVAYKMTNSKIQNISLNALCSELQLEGNTLKDKVKSIYRHDPRYWVRRPLTKQMLNYASSDVTSLLQIYEKLHPLIEEKEEFKEFCEEQINMLILPDQIRQKKKFRKNLQDVDLLKKKFEACTNLSGLALSNREIRLIKHLELPNEIIQQLPLRIYKKLTKSPTPSTNQQYQSGGSNNSDNEPMSLEPCSLDSLITTLDLLLERTNNPGLAPSEESPKSEVAGTVDGLSKDLRLMAKEGKTTCEIGTQTISTGDIILTNIYDG